VRKRPVLRVRKSGAALVASGIAFVGTVPFAGTSWALAPVLLIPLGALAWSWRAGTDVYLDELRVRALFGGNRVPWSRVTELAPDQRGRVSALLDNGNVIRLTGITRENLPLVLAAVDKTPVSSPAGEAGRTGEAGEADGPGEGDERAAVES
jgi:hypothetical protein